MNRLLGVHWNFLILKKHSERFTQVFNKNYFQKLLFAHVECNRNIPHKEHSTANFQFWFLPHPLKTKVNSKFLSCYFLFEKKKKKNSNGKSCFHIFERAERETQRKVKIKLRTKWEMLVVAFSPPSTFNFLLFLGLFTSATNISFEIIQFYEMLILIQLDIL